MAECKRLRNENETGPDCGCRGSACALAPEVEGTVPSQWWLDLKIENQKLRAQLEAAQGVVAAFTTAAEDWNDGTFALWNDDDLVVALVKLRQVMS